MSEDQQTDDELSEGMATEIPFNISHQYVKDLSFESPAAPDLFIEAHKQSPDIQIDVQVEAHRLSEKRVEVVLTVEAKATGESATLFIAELAYAAIVEVGQVSNEHLHAFIMIEVPRLLFPFARSIVADVISDGGFPPLLIQPVDFVKMYHETANNAAKAAQEE